MSLGALRDQSTPFDLSRCVGSCPGLRRSTYPPAMPQNPPPDPIFRDDADFERLRDVFARAGFHPQAFAQAYGTPSPDAFRAQPKPTQAAVTSQGRPIDTFTRLFVMFEPVPRALFEQAIAPMSIDAWSVTGLVESKGDTVFPAVGFTFFEGLVLLHDAFMEVGPTYVMGVARTTALLAYQCVTRPPGAALDLGTGCGCIALLASRAYQHVLGTDINPRAISVSRFNARLNNITNVEFRVGDLYEPARAFLKERGLPGYRAIYCNPPYVITPGSSFMYRDSGRKGDQIVEACVREGAPLLAPGGIAQFGCNVAHLAGMPWERRIAAWLEGGGCDAYVLQNKTIAPIEYASQWIEETEKHATPEQRWTLLAQWMENFARLGIQAISYGFITLSKPTEGVNRANWFGVDQTPDDLKGATGLHLAQILANRDLLASLGSGKDADEAFAAVRLAPSASLRIDRNFRPAATGTPGSPAGGLEWKLERSAIHLAQGYPFPRDMDARHVDFLMALDGRKTLREVVEQVAAAAKAPPAALLPVCLKLARELMGRAYVVPV